MSAQLWRLVVLLVIALIAWRLHEHFSAPKPTLASLGVREPVLLLETQSCGYCRLVRRGLDAARVPYAAWDVQQDEHARVAWHALRARGVPVVLIGDETVYGYDAARMEALLLERGHRVEFP